MKQISTGVFVLLLISFLGLASAQIETYSPFESDTGKYIMPAENLGGPWYHTDHGITLGDDKNATITYNENYDNVTVAGADLTVLKSLNVKGNIGVNGTVISNGKVSDPMWVDDRLYVTGTAALNATTVTTLRATGAITGALTGTASRIAAGTFIDTGYGLKNSTANKAQVNLSASSGLEFGSGATQGALKIDATDASLTLAAGGVSVRSGIIKRTLVAGTGAATNVTVSGMAVGDELVSVVAYTTAVSIASMVDRTSEYVVATGHLYKAAGTNSTGNQLDIMWLDRT